MSEHKAGLLDVPEADYHADRATLSVSGAKKLLKSPARFRYEMDNPPEPKDVFDFGHVAHELVLGKGAGYRILEHDSYRSKEAKEERDNARALGVTPILRAEYERAAALAEAVKTDDDAAPFFVHGRAETSMYGVHQETGVGLRGRADWITKRRDGTYVVVDVKTCASSEADAIDQSMWKLGYAMQAAWYVDLLEQNGHPGAEFYLIYAEKASPHWVQVAYPSSDALTYGRALNEKAIRLYAHCVETNTWPKPPIHEANVSSYAWKALDDE